MIDALDIVQLFSNIERKDLKPSTSMCKLGMDSLSYLTMFKSLEGQYGIDISEEEALRIGNVKQLFQLLKIKGVEDNQLKINN